ncbi:efflux RND transporter periplasmic adaptor subunit [Luteimonas notoginsengisoli]|uniref:Efflux RND transporter periplasmic adaptor subunit n=1 Tax=Luteimonas notoginsengisoli TaxID=1578200 RepID=A0ABV7UTW8_9GAMM
MNPRLARAWPLVAALLLAGCGEAPAPPVTETVAAGPLLLEARGDGVLRSSKPTPLQVPGNGWSSRRIEWMLPEGSRVKKGALIARFSSEESEQDLAQALVDLQRNALARAAKDEELASAQGRVGVDMAQVATGLAIARRYAGADLSTLARNEVLDAIEDVHYLEARQDTLLWQRGQASVRGGAELALLDAQRATFDLDARARREDLDALELRAPNDGVLMLSASWSGVKPATGASLYAGSEFGSLPDAAAMEIELSLPQLESQGVRLGQAVEMFPLGRPADKIASKLSWVASAPKSRSRSDPVKYLSMRAPVPPQAAARLGLVPGQQMRARVIQLDAAKAISVPNVALRSHQGALMVRVRDGHDFAWRKVKLGVRGVARTQVLSGLSPGDQVLLANAAVPEDDANDETAGDGKPDRRAGAGADGAAADGDAAEADRP